MYMYAAVFLPRVSKTVIFIFNGSNDLVVLAPPTKGIQPQLNVCSKFGRENDILYNSQKSQIILFDTRKFVCTTDIYLNNMPMKYTESYKYLGHIIDFKLNNEADMKSKERSLYGRCNMLIHKFYHCSSAVKTDCSCPFEGILENAVSIS